MSKYRVRVKNTVKAETHKTSGYRFRHSGLILEEHQMTDAIRGDKKLSVKKIEDKKLNEKEE